MHTEQVDIWPLTSTKLYNKFTSLISYKAILPHNSCYYQTELSAWHTEERCMDITQDRKNDPT